MASRDRLHRLVDAVPEQEVRTAEVFLEFLGQRDKVKAALDAAPEVDEPLTAEEEEGLAEAKADIAAGRFYSAEEAKRRLLG